MTSEQIAARKQEDAERNPPRTETVIAQTQVVQPRASTLVPTAAAAVPPPAPQVGVTFTSSPVGAEVIIDGMYWGSTPTAELKRIKDGEHTVVVRKRGFKLWERTISIAAGEGRAVHADLEAEAVDPTKTRIIGLE